MNLQWQDENGYVLSSYDGPLIGQWSPCSAPRDSVCLRFVNPWGDTTFNQLQIPVLLEELATLARDYPDFRDALEAISGFVSSMTDHNHTYLKFIGD